VGDRRILKREQKGNREEEKKDHTYKEREKKTQRKKTNFFKYQVCFFPSG